MSHAKRFVDGCKRASVPCFLMEKIPPPSGKEVLQTTRTIGCGLKDTPLP